tara:strand:- start:1519 stop:4266 length:2748 start_codon:yes stop_codon:yes gene_type:complete
MSKLSTVEILGAGPAGLYTAILIRRLMPHVHVRVTEQNPKGATFGFGVVFSDRALDFLRKDDAEIHDLIVPHMERWQNVTLNMPGGEVAIDGVGFTAIGRLELIEILREYVEGLGVEIRFDTIVDDLSDLKADLIIGADGLNSLSRGAFEDQFKPKIEYFDNRFAWFGATVPFDALTQTFIETDKGPLNAHHYRYAPDRSTFIVECDAATYDAYGFEHMSEAESATLCGTLFSDVLKGTDLVCNKSNWRQFPRLWCENWVAGRNVILGDAAHTAHFSIGSGTRLALEDALALVTALTGDEDVDKALAVYNSERPPIAKKIVDAANRSAIWYETFGEKMHLPPLEFGFNYLSRSGRLNMERMRQVAPEFMRDYEAQKAKNPQSIPDPVPATVPGSEEIGFVKADHKNCSGVLWRNLPDNADKLALIGPAGDVTYGELAAEAARWGNAFKAAGLARGERIAMFLEDTPSYPASVLGAIRAGFVPVLLNTQTKPDVLNYFLSDSGARYAVVEASLTQLFDANTRKGTDLTAIVVVNGEANGSELIAAQDFLDGQSTELEVADTKPDDMAFWMYSSGSTGQPKGIVHLQHDMAYSFFSFGKNVLKLNRDDICFSVPKIYFAYGFGNSITFPFAVGATTLLLPGQPTPAKVLEGIETYKPTVFFGLPTLYTALANSPDVVSRDLSSIRQSMSAAEILSQEVYDGWEKLVGHGPTEGLGSTELLHIYLSNTPDDQRIGAAGARVPGYEIKLMTPFGKEAEEGEEGIMHVRGHSSAPCYWNRPDKTSETMKGSWINTGDRFIEEDGYYYFQGRADDLIKVSGQWVWPLEVERCLNDHADVHECAILAVQLEDKRMALRAFVHLKPGQSGDKAQTKKLRDFVKSQLTPFKSPRLIEYLDGLPHTGTGKIDRQALITMTTKETT